MKVNSREITHKSDTGGVLLNLGYGPGGARGLSRGEHGEGVRGVGRPPTLDGVAIEPHDR